MREKRFLLLTLSEDQIFRDDSGESEKETSMDHDDEEEKDCTKDYINNKTVLQVER